MEVWLPETPITLGQPCIIAGFFKGSMVYPDMIYLWWAVPSNGATDHPIPLDTNI